MYATRLFGSPVSTSVLKRVEESTAESEKVITMPLDPMDSLWMSKAPQIRPDFDTDCLWKPPTRPSRFQKERTISMESTDSELGRKLSMNESASPRSVGPTSPIEMQPRARRISISEMLFGSSPSSFSWGMGSSPPSNEPETERRMSITDDQRFKDFMKHQSKILGDDGVSAGFKRSNYMKD